MKKILSLLLLPLLPLLTQCSSSDGGGGKSSATLPTLSSPARAKAWGAPEVLKGAGGYRTIYTNPANPKEKVSIIGSSKMMPFFVYPPRIKGTTANGVAAAGGQPQVWKKSLIQGTTVKWYQVSFPDSENGAKFSTLGIELKGQDGTRGQFKIEMEGTKNQVPSWLAELRFAN